MTTLGNFPSASSIAATDYIPVEQGGVLKKATPSLLPFVQSGSGALTGSVQTELRRVVYPEQFGALRDGTTDDLAAFQAADTYLVSLGGGTMRLLPGTYLLSSRYQPSSGIHIIGAGVGVTKLKNTAAGSPGNVAIDIRGALGTAYAINTPSEGANTVTTTTAGNAGNFTIGDNIALAGPISGNDYIPFLITTVSGVNAGTGVITLGEYLRRPDYTQVLKVTTLITNVLIRDLSITQAADTGLIAKYCRDLLIDNVQITTTNNGAQIIASREVMARQLVCIGKKILLHSCVDCTFVQPVVRGADFDLEGGCSEVDVIGAKVYDPGTTGITINTGSRRCHIIGGSIENVAANSSGVNIDGSSYSNSGEHSIIGVSISGGGNGSTTGVSAGTSDRNVITGNTIRGCTNGVAIGTGSCVDNVVYGNAITGATTNYSVAAGSNVLGEILPSITTTFTDGDTTPTVKNGKVFVTGNTSPTSITTFDDGVEGQLITIIFRDANTTLVASGSLRLDGSANLVSASDKTVQLVFKTGLNWFQVGKVSVNN